MLDIDHTLCSGSGHCVDIAPDLFELRSERSWPTSRTREASPDLLHQVAESCPWFAITYTEEPA